MRRRSCAHPGCCPGRMNWPGMWPRLWRSASCRNRADRTGAVPWERADRRPGTDRVGERQFEGVSDLVDLGAKTSDVVPGDIRVSATTSCSTLVRSTRAVAMPARGSAARVSPGVRASGSRWPARWTTRLAPPPVVTRAREAPEIEGGRTPPESRPRRCQGPVGRRRRASGRSRPPTGR